KRGHPFKWAVDQASQNRIGNIPYPRLDRQKRGGQPSLCNFVSQKLEQMPGNCVGVFIWWRERQVPIRSVGFNDSHDLVWITAERCLSNTIRWAKQWDRHPMRGQCSTVINIVHAFQCRALPLIDLKNHLVCTL